jgi:hypothetical protein
MEPLDANMNMKGHELELSGVGESIPMVKTDGGHFVISTDEFEQKSVPEKHKR